MRGNVCTVSAITATFAWIENAHGTTAAQQEISSIQNSVSIVIVFYHVHEDHCRIRMELPFHRVRAHHFQGIGGLVVGENVHVGLAAIGGG